MTEKDPSDPLGPLQPTIDRRRPWLVSGPLVAVQAAVFAATFAAGREAVLAACRTWNVGDCPPYWPISVFLPRWPHPLGWVWAVVVLATAWPLVRWLARRRFPLGATLIAGVTLTAATSLLQGPSYGFAGTVASARVDGVWYPISDRGQGYWHEARAVRRARTYLRRYNELQPQLRIHGQTHPPGAVLLMYGAKRALQHPAAIAVVLGIAALLVLGVSVHRLFGRETGPEEAGYWTLLLLLLPAIQIYGIYSLDVVVAALLLAALAVFRLDTSWLAVTGATLLLASCGLLTFGVLFAGPVLVAVAWFDGRPWRALAVVCGVAAVYTWIWWDSGFSYWTSFRFASAIENPQGFRLLASPKEYFQSRLEGLAEVFLFFGPVLTVGWWQARGGLVVPSSHLARVGLVAFATFLAMLTVGAYRTGETTRTCLFLTPLLLAALAGTRRLDARSRQFLVMTSFTQTVVMQLFGFYVA